MKTLQLLMIATVLTVLSCAKKENVLNEQLKGTKPVSVKTAYPEIGTHNELHLSGQIEATQSVLISTKVMGYVTKIYATVGQRVLKGELLVSISQQDVLAQGAQVGAGLKEAEAALVSAQKDYERYVRLYEKGSATAKELQNITLAYESAKSQVEGAKQKEKEVLAMMSYVNVRAPFSGIVTQKFVDEGSMSTPGAPILALENPEEFQVRMAVPEIDITKIKKGQKISIHLKSNGEEIGATIHEISSSSNYTGGQYIVKARIQPRKLTNIYSGMYVNAIIPVDKLQDTTMNRMYIPLSSVIQRDQLTGVFVVLHDRAVLRWIRVGKTKGEYIEVLSGLDEKEQYILKPSSTIKNGTPIKG